MRRLLCPLRLRTRTTILTTVALSSMLGLSACQPSVRHRALQLRAEYAPQLEIRVDERGFVPAAQRLLAAGQVQDTTNYNAIWVRDSVWAALALLHEAPARGQRLEWRGTELRTQGTWVLARLQDYFATSAQLARQRAIIASPKLAQGELGKMRVIHIRFDSKTLDDVQENGRAQIWNHRQNDALGLFLAAWIDLLQRGAVPTQALSPEAALFLARMPAYFAAIDFSNFEDAGPWEEIDRVNSSSIGLVVRALEQYRQWLGSPAERRALLARISLSRGELAALDDSALRRQIERGYERLRKNLKLGGESPDYPKNDPRYREADAALLNLIYPYPPLQLTWAERAQALERVLTLVGERGTRRYWGDSYQAAGFWTRVADTGDFSSAESFAERGKRVIANAEAQWFFDSWIARSAHELARLSGQKRWEELEGRFIERALAQLTPGRRGEQTPSADPKQPVPSAEFPESWNVVLVGGDARGERSFLPSPITPLNWARASLRLALEATTPR